MEGENLGSFRGCGREILLTSDLWKEKILEASVVAEGNASDLRSVYFVLPSDFFKRRFYEPCTILDLSEE